MNMPLIAPRPLAVRCVDLADDSDCARIAGYVRGHPDGTPFHLPAWQAAVARGCRQRGMILVAETAGTICGVLPLTLIRSALFGRALVSTGFAVGGGIIDDDGIAVEQLGAAAWALAGELGCSQLDLRGGSFPDQFWSVDATTYLGFVRPIAVDDAAELAAIPRKQRADVRKALDRELGVTIGRDPAQLASHYRVYAESVRNLGTPVFPALLFRSVVEAFGADADLLTIDQEGRPLASVLSLYHNGTVYPYWGGGTHEARALRANDRLYFALMSHARARGCTRFDFGRSKAGTGAAAFKKNWGFEATPLVYASRVEGGGEPRKLNPLDPRYRLQIALWKKLPLWVANRAGPAIARGLG